tara:strand:- start:764 stop:1027 length:264 start_codon:yes stop_codon:yes gene_type:complete
MTEKFAITDLLKKAANLLPANAAHIRDEFEQNLRPLIESSFAKMNLVTREEFDQHLTLLSRLEEKTAALEAELETLKGSSTTHKNHN